METPENPEYMVWFVKNIGAMALITVYRKGASPLHKEACVYRVKADESTIRRTYHELIAVMQWAGETSLLGDVRCVLDRESILAVVPQWEKVI